MASIHLSRPIEQEVSASLKMGSQAQALPGFSPKGPVHIVAFLRHVGCPFAEHTVKKLRKYQVLNQHVDICLVSHVAEPETKQWLSNIGGLGQMQLICDPERKQYGAWGLGYSNIWHFLGLRSLLGAIRLMFLGIRNRSAFGTRWQRAGLFFIKSGKVVWLDVPSYAAGFTLPPDDAWK